MVLTARIIAGALALSLSALLTGPIAPAAADDPPFLGWEAVMPPLAYQFEPSSADSCVAGRVSCVKDSERQMQRRFTPLAETCDHDAVFALAYLRTTQAYLEATQTNGFFENPQFINHEEVVFGEMYMDAYDDWAAGRVAQVPPAWRVALAAADDRAVSGSGNLLLGMSAHVNRDLAFVLAATGLVRPDGRSAKTDHDRVNVVLNRVIQPLLAELGQRFDPQIPNIRTPYGVGHTALMQTLVAWREVAWRHAEQLVAARTDAERDAVAARIEAYAVTEALTLRALWAYAPPLTTSAARDRYCAAAGQGG
jgi:hypothetical protein